MLIYSVRCRELLFLPLGTRICRTLWILVSLTFSMRLAEFLRCDFRLISPLIPLGMGEVNEL